jgi:hypothetical protein
MKEADLVRLKATTMTERELREEIYRIQEGISCATSIGAVKRYQARREIMESELRSRFHRNNGNPDRT